MRASQPHRTRARRAVVTAAACGSILILGAAAPAMADTHGQVLAVGDIPTVIGNLRNWLIGILAAVATLFLTIGGVRYVISGGNPGEIEKAKSAFKAAAVGYALAVLAPVFMTILQSVVG
ncbi:pilin [Catenulispora subtropica]|uniref:TrbC/VIRB2 family protein n=1 Tax=Catenulispora subtropica TaxID=450798 RepID=A0ABP5CQK3_9ACTN